MNHTIIVPTYGRDYTTGKACKADFNANKSFIINNLFDPSDGKPCNKSDLTRAGITNVEIRYARLTKLVMVKL